MIAALVPINMLIGRFFPPQYVEALVAEDLEEEEEIHILD
jgi:hypothetical protein